MKTIQINVTREKNVFQLRHPRKIKIHADDLGPQRERIVVYRSKEPLFHSFA